MLGMCIEIKCYVIWSFQSDFLGPAATSGEWWVNQSFKNRAGFSNIGLLSVQAPEVKLVRNVWEVISCYTICTNRRWNL